MTIRSLQIGGVTTPHNILLAPMSGVSDLPFRKIVRKYCGALVFSEMIASNAMIRQTRQSLRMAKIGFDEQPLAIQLAGCEPHVMQQASSLVQDMGAKIVDINMGCPMKRIVNNFSGSHLMRDLALAKEIIAATIKGTNLPVTLKMRLGWDDNSFNAPMLAKIAEEEGIAMITVHGRTRCQIFNGTADWEKVAAVKRAVKIPVIVNGDIIDEKSATMALEKSGADGIMVGRGTYGKPWLLAQLLHHFNHSTAGSDNKYLLPTLRDKRKIVLEHMEEMLNFYNPTEVVMLARKHLGWYSKGLTNATEFRRLINQNTNPEELLKLVNEFFIDENFA